MWLFFCAENSRAYFDGQQHFVQNKKGCTDVCGRFLLCRKRKEESFGHINYKSKSEKEKKENAMYYDKFLNLIDAIMNDNALTQKQKDERIDEAKEAIIKITTISDTIIDAKFGVRKFNSQEEYTAVIDLAKNAVPKIDEIYKKYFGIPLFDKAQETTSRLYDLSRILSNELFKEYQNMIKEEEGD